MADDDLAEMQAILDAPNPVEWKGIRDRAMLHVCYSAGLRVSELIGLRLDDLTFQPQGNLLIHGKGRRERCLPLWKTTVEEIRAWLRRNASQGVDAALLPNRDGRPMTRSNVTQRLDLAVTRATKAHSSLAKRRISPHIIRHTTAMHLLQSGVAFSVIALWLGHESMSTTHRYVEADLAMKEKALAKLQEPGTKMHRYVPPDELMQFLQAL